MQQRYYDPFIGQHFLSVDPVTAYSPGGAFNQYWYANANPYGMVDPDGRDPRRSSANEVYLASGGDWGSGQTVSAGKKKAQNSQPLTIPGKLSRNFRWLRDSIKVEGAIAFTLGGSLKIGPLKAQAELGSISGVAAGATLARAYGYTEVRHPSGGISLGRFGLMHQGAVDRTYQGGSFREEHTDSTNVILMDHSEANMTSGEISARVSIVPGLIEVNGVVDVGKIAIALFYWGNSTEEP